MGSWTQSALGGGWASKALNDDEPLDVGVTLEGLDADAAAAEQSNFKPWSGPEQIPATNNQSAGTPVWGDPDDQMLDAFADGTARASNAMFMGWGDNALSALSPEMGSNLRDRLALAQERSPTASLAGDVIGGGVSALATGGAAAGAARALPFAGRLAAGAGLGAEQAGLTAAGYADDGDRMEAAFSAVPAGLVLGAGGEALGTGLEAGGRWARDIAAPWLREQGLMNRVASSGLYGGSMDRLAQNIGGKEGVVELGQWMENNGLDQLTPGGIGDEAKSLNSMRQGDQRSFLDELADRPEGPPLVDTGEIIDSLQGRRGELSGLPDSDSATQAMQYGTQARNIADKSYPGSIGGQQTHVQPFEQAWRSRQGYDAGVDYNKLGGSREDALYEGVARDAANGYRGGLVESLENTSPELAPRWESIQEDLGNSTTIMNAGLSRELRETGNQPLSLPSLVGAAGGGLPGMAAAAAVKTGGRAALANTERAASSAFDSFGGAMANNAGAASMTGGLAGADVAGRRDGIAEAGRGFLLPQAALELMRQPGSLGKWEREFFEAANSDDSHAIATLITKLSQTDPDFRQQLLPQLQQLTATGY